MSALPADNALATQDEGKPLCQWCSAPYSQKRPWQRFCSESCRSESWQTTHPRISIGAIKLQKGDKKPTAEQLEAAGFKVRRAK